MSTCVDTTTRGIVLYATWLLRRHTRTFALLRQLYLTTAGDTNLWRAVHMPTSILQQMLVQGRGGDVGG